MNPLQFINQVNYYIGRVSSIRNSVKFSTGDSGGRGVETVVYWSVEILARASAI